METTDDESLVVYTLRWGDKSWLRRCSRTLEDWCGRHGYELKVITESDPRYPHPKFCCVDILRSFIASGNSRMLYVDGDVHVAPDAPPFTVDSPGAYIKPDGVTKTVRDWWHWRKAHYGHVNGVGWIYRNAGVWSVDQAGARALIDQADSRPFIKGWADQHQTNEWFLAANLAGMPLHHLPDKWNLMWDELNQFFRPGWFYHLTGPEKIGKLNHILSKISARTAK